MNWLIEINAHILIEILFISAISADIISITDVKKQMRDVIFVEDTDGNLVKYVRAMSNENPKPKRNSKAAAAAVVAAPLPALSKPLPKIPECSVAVVRLSNSDIHKIQMEMKKLPATNDTDSSAPFSKWSAKMEKDGISVFCSNQFVILEPVLLRNCVINPLLEPMFVLGEHWLIDLDVNLNLIIQLPERDGRREKFVFSSDAWNAWFSHDDISTPQIQNSNDFCNDNISSLMDVNTSEFLKLVGQNGDEMLAAMFSSSLFMRAESISMCSNDENGYDASIEVGLSRFK